jgi:hypothetical protein
VAAINEAREKGIALQLRLLARRPRTTRKATLSTTLRSRGR